MFNDFQSKVEQSCDVFDIFLEAYEFHKGLNSLAELGPSNALKLYYRYCNAIQSKHFQGSDIVAIVNMQELRVNELRPCCH